MQISKLRTCHEITSGCTAACHIRTADLILEGRAKAVTNKRYSVSPGVQLRLDGKGSRKHRRSVAVQYTSCNRQLHLQGKVRWENLGRRRH